MERRSFIATLFAPLLRRFIPVKPATELPVQSVPLMGGDRLTAFAWSAMINDDLETLRDTPALFGRVAKVNWHDKTVTLRDGSAEPFPARLGGAIS